MNKWKKLQILINWLEQGRLLEIENVKYGISEDGYILRMYNEEEGIEIPTLRHIFSLIDKISDDKIFLMNGEIVLTNENN